jgi:hypothetical protein
VSVTMTQGWLEDVLSATDRLFEDILGPEIAEDARALCPVFGGENSTATEVSLKIAESLGRPIPGGALRDSIEHHLDGHDLIVAATGDAARSYAYWVHGGHDVVVFGRPMGYRKEATPFLEMALYQFRGGI